MTECTTEQLHFSFCRKRKLTVNFQGGEITSDAGLLLIREADDSLRLTSGIAGSIEDRRDSRYAEHSMGDLLRQRVYQIVAGYEDCNDADLLRKDPALKAACDRLLSDQDLASQPTLFRRRPLTNGSFQTANEQDKAQRSRKANIRNRRHRTGEGRP